MHGAAYNAYPLVAKLLAERGADPQIWKNPNRAGGTPLFIAEGYADRTLQPRCTDDRSHYKVDARSRRFDSRRTAEGSGYLPEAPRSAQACRTEELSVIPGNSIDLSCGGINAEQMNQGALCVAPTIIVGNYTKWGSELGANCRQIPADRVRVEVPVLSRAEKLLLPHAEVVIGDVSYCSIVGDSLQGEFIIAGCQSTCGDFESYGIRRTYTSTRKISPSQDIFSATSAKLGSETRVVVPIFELNLDARHLSTWSQHEPLYLRSGAREAGQ